MASYKLKIAFSKETNVVEFPFNSVNESSYKKLYFDELGGLVKADASGNKKETTVSLVDLYCHKEMFKPGHVRFRLQIDFSLAGSLNVDYGKMFKDSFIYLTKEENGNSCVVAKRYPVFDLSQTEDVNSGQSVYISVNAYSPDKYLTLRKFSKAYTGKKLYDDILVKGGNAIWTDLLANEVKFENNDGKHVPVLMNFDALRFQKDENEKPKEGEEPTKKKVSQLYTEYIQPYLVQYDESPFDFLVRTMNRCRECFYYEDGAIMLGWLEPSLIKDSEFLYAKGSNSGASATTITAYESLRVNEQLVMPSVSYNLYKDYTEYDKFDEPKNKENYNVFPAAADELLEVLPKPTDYVTSSDYPWSEFGGVFMDCLNERTLGEMIASFILCDTTLLISFAEQICIAQGKYKNKYWNEKEAYQDERLSDYDVSKNEKKAKEKDKDQEPEPKKFTAMRAYSTGLNLLHKFSNEVIFDTAFYSLNQKGIEKAESKRVHVNFGTHFVKLLLGSKISLKGIEYVVVSITEDCNTSSCEIEALPLKVKVDGDTNEYFFPPMVGDNSFIRVSKPQRGFVTAVQDPLRMGRVQIRYPWQNIPDATEKYKPIYSPWMRMVLPMASEGCGFNFLPEIDDEVIVNFENGNVEKPYVEGMVYNATRVPSGSDKVAKERSITSRNGHSITFRDPVNGTDALKGISPAWKFLSKFIPGMGGKFPDAANDEFRKGAGGIELTDSYGIYSIRMSTDNRSISIDSPYGEVNMNAFTGISISAPHGDVHIEGKNVTIEAGNNLTLESGLNRKPYLPYKNDSGQTLTATQKIIPQLKQVGKTIGYSVLKKMQIVDMKFLRTVFESIVRPVRGTLELKSNRYIYLEAGTGDVEIRDLSKPADIEDFCRDINTNLALLITMYDGLVNTVASHVGQIDQSKQTFEGLDALTAEQYAALGDLSSLKTQKITKQLDPALNLSGFVQSVNNLDLNHKSARDVDSMFAEMVQRYQNQPDLVKSIFNDMKAKVTTSFHAVPVEFKHTVDGTDHTFEINKYVQDNAEESKRKFVYDCLEKLQEKTKAGLSHIIEIPNIQNFSTAQWQSICQNNQNFNLMEVPAAEVPLGFWLKMLNTYTGNGVSYFSKEIWQQYKLDNGFIAFANKDNTYVLDDKTIRKADELSSTTNINTQLDALRNMLNQI